MTTAFTASGRIGRVRYLICLMSYIPLIMLLSLLGPLYLIGVLLSMASYVCVTIQRCHDLGISGWWSLVFGIPGVNVALLFVPARPANRYGEPDVIERRDVVVALVMVLMTSTACGAYYLYTFRPAIQAYETRNAIGGRTWKRISGASSITQFEFTSPVAGFLVLENGQRVATTYRARYHDLYVSFEMDGARFTEPLRYDLKSGRIEMLDVSATVGWYAAE